MTTMIAEVYDALREAGAGEAASRRAAAALEGTGDRFNSLDRRMDGLEHKIGAVEQRLGYKIDAVETRLRNEQVLIRWILGTILTVVIASALKTFLH